jgi:hypothetical protein
MRTDMPEDKDDRRSDSAPAVETGTPNQEYKVGPGRPPKEHQFKPGQSGNPKGAKRKPRSIAVDLKALLGSALNKKITLKQGQREQIVTMAAAGIEQLVAQYAKGDRHARRDVFLLADKFGVDLVPDESSRDKPLTSEYEAMLETWVAKQYNKVVPRPRVFAPPELLDDDSSEI